MSGKKLKEQRKQASDPLETATKIFAANLNASIAQYASQLARQGFSQTSITEYVKGILTGLSEQL